MRKVLAATQARKELLMATLTTVAESERVAAYNTETVPRFDYTLSSCKARWPLTPISRAQREAQMGGSRCSSWTRSVVRSAAN
jgi:hypothetical protein